MNTTEFFIKNRTIYKTIESLCIKKGLSLSGLSLKAGLTSTALNPCKTKGDRSLKTITLLRLIDGLGIDTIEFFKEYEKIIKTLETE